MQGTVSQNVLTETRLGVLNDLELAAPSVLRLRL